MIICLTTAGLLLCNVSPWTYTSNFASASPIEREKVGYRKNRWMGSSACHHHWNNFSCILPNLLCLIPLHFCPFLSLVCLFSLPSASPAGSFVPAGELMTHVGKLWLFCYCSSRALLSVQLKALYSAISATMRCMICCTCSAYSVQCIFNAVYVLASIGLDWNYLNHSFYVSGIKT